MAKHGWIVSWTERRGDRSQVTVDGFDTPEEAFATAIRDAKAFGWTEPKWWQWWRRYDQPRSAEFQT